MGTAARGAHRLAEEKPHMPYRTPKNPVLRAGLFILLGLAIVVMILAVIWYIVLLHSSNLGFNF
ncbi:hypothetical protein K7472_04600 [Streptomyces sp. PTM05]|uniref:Uncharacterized protein n=1 Tax=Streptantibioticus parmotrematis TaxID=2873249 RepID=A0ABS7QLW2_9ACTN|nr:hypothetical protein [Streptantibioticus parmotrematis]MBY8884125.1 hypothetical protein [Streptantibioticus parmotrematis]